MIAAWCNGELFAPFTVVRESLDMRKAAKLTQQELAKLSGIKQPQLARLETGGQLPRLDTLANLAKEAGYSLELHLIPQSQELSITHRSCNFSRREKLHDLSPTITLWV